MAVRQEPAWKSAAGLGWAGPCWAGLGWAGLGWVEVGKEVPEGERTVSAGVLVTGEVGVRWEADQQLPRPREATRREKSISKRRSRLLLSLRGFAEPPKQNL